MVALIVVLISSSFQPELGLGSNEYEVTEPPVASKTDNPELTSVRLFPGKTYPVTFPPRFFPTEEEPRTDYVTGDTSTESQDRESATLAPRLKPETIEKPPGPGPLLSVLIALLFLAIVMFIIQVRLITILCLTASLT
jgi:hypothetical protein